MDKGKRGVPQPHMGSPKQNGDGDRQMSLSARLETDQQGTEAATHVILEATQTWRDRTEWNHIIKESSDSNRCWARCLAPRKSSDILALYKSDYYYDDDNNDNENSLSLQMSNLTGLKLLQHHLQVGQWRRIAGDGFLCRRQLQQCIVALFRYHMQLQLKTLQLLCWRQPATDHRHVSCKHLLNITVLFK